MELEDEEMIEEMNSVDLNDALEILITAKESNTMVEITMKLLKQKMKLMMLRMKKRLKENHIPKSILLLN